MGIQKFKKKEHKKNSGKKVVILVAVVIMAQKHMKRLVVFSYIHKVSSNKMFKIYYIYTHNH